eukprot:6484876-Amphidinium_carterae.1
MDAIGSMAMCFGGLSILPYILADMLSPKAVAYTVGKISSIRWLVREQCLLRNTKQPVLPSCFSSPHQGRKQGSKQAMRSIAHTHIVFRGRQTVVIFLASALLLAGSLLVSFGGT